MHMNRVSSENMEQEMDGLVGSLKYTWSYVESNMATFRNRVLNDRQRSDYETRFTSLNKEYADLTNRPSIQKMHRLLQDMQELLRDLQVIVRMLY